MIKAGMVVRYAPQWCTAEERHCLMVVLEAYPDVERCLVRHINSNMTIQPTETVSFEMVIPTGIDVSKMMEE